MKSCLNRNPADQPDPHVSTLAGIIDFTDPLRQLLPLPTIRSERDPAAFPHGQGDRIVIEFSPRPHQPADLEPELMRSPLRTVQPERYLATVFCADPQPGLPQPRPLPADRPRSDRVESGVSFGFSHRKHRDRHSLFTAFEFPQISPRIFKTINFTANSILHMRINLQELQSHFPYKIAFPPSKTLFLPIKFTRLRRRRLQVRLLWGVF